MEDGPEEAEDWYEHNGERYRLVEAESEIWKVYGGGVYLRRVLAVSSIETPEGPTGPQYTLDFVGEENRYDEPATDVWRLVLEYLIDNAAPTSRSMSVRADYSEPTRAKSGRQLP